MDPKTTQLFDLAILRVLDKARPRFGYPADVLARFVAPEGFTATEDEVLDRIAYLESKGLVEEVLKGIHKAVRTWRVTPAGITYLDETGG